MTLGCLSKRKTNRIKNCENITISSSAMSSMWQIVRVLEKAYPLIIGTDKKAVQSIRWLSPEWYYNRYQINGGQARSDTQNMNIKYNLRENVKTIWVLFQVKTDFHSELK